MADSWITGKSDRELVKLIRELETMPKIDRYVDYSDTIHKAYEEAFKRGMRTW